jgi:outer membrane protein assembly factor BamB
MSSPIVWKDRVFLTGANDESRDVYCLNAENGMPIWTHPVSDLPGAPENGELPRVLDSTGYAAPTMTTNGRLVAAVFATGELVCLNMNGERVWAKHLGMPDNHYGHSSSLICNDELLFVQYDQKENAKLYAFKMANGDPVWQADRDQLSWSSPILIHKNGRSELVLTDSKSVASYDSATGERYWRVECLDGEVASSAAFAGGYIFVANEGAAASAIDISNHEEEPSIVWQWDESLPDAASPLVSKDLVLLPTAFGVVSCLAAKTGEVLWEQEFDRGFTSSPVSIDDRVYLTDLAGNTQIFRLSDQFELLGESSIGEPVYATPAIVGSRVYIRGLYHLVCVGEVR